MKRPSEVLILATVLLATVAVQAQGVSRIPAKLDDARTELRGNVHPLARAIDDRGKVADGLQLDRITLFFNRSAAQQAELEALLEAQQDPSSPEYHKWLTPEQYAERFGVSESDMARTAQWLEAQGFTVLERALGRQYVAFSGTAGRVRAAFGTEIHSFDVRGEMHFANASEPSLPRSLAQVALGFSGLHDFRPKARAVRVSPKFTSDISGNHFLVPDDFATIYHLKPLYDQGIDGTGQKVAIMGQTNIPLADIATFRSLSGLSVNPPTVLQIPGSNTSISSGDITEADLDVEWSGAVARNAQIIYVNAGTAANMSTFDSLNYAITNQTAPVISISYGNCENPSFGWSSAQITSINSMLQTASTQGQTVVGPGGDTGAADCENTTATSAVDGLSVDFPASSPYVTGVGGTMFNGGGNPNSTTDVCNGTCWSSVSNSVYGSALVYIPENVWNETATNPNNSVPANTNCTVGTNCIIVAGGGGLSTIFSKPAWQTALTPADGQRDVPDISLGAAFIHDGYLICASQQSPLDCTNGFRRSDTTLDVIGGTSAGAPTFAGIVALLNQKKGAPQGNVNSALYTLAAVSPDAFHDITTGSNIVPCTQGKPDCPATAPFQIGYNAGAGYDYASGLGTVDAYALISELAGGPMPTPAAPDFTIAPTGSTTLNITHGTSQPVSVNIAGVNGFAGMVTFSCIVPTALVGVSCTLPSPNPMAVPNAGTFTITASSTAKLAPQPGSSPTFFAWTGGGTALLAGFLLLGGDDRKRSKKNVAALLGITLLALFLLGGVLSGCGGSSGGTVNPPPPPPPPTPESGTIVLQGKSGANIHTVAITVNVN